MSPRTVGFVGLGIMGKPMAQNVIEAGYDVVAHNRSREPVEEVTAAGATPATSPAEVAAESDVVITVLPNTTAVESVVTGEDGILEELSEGQIYIDMSTIDPGATERLAERIEAAGGRMLDAPISGGEEGAVDATLSIISTSQSRLVETSAC